MKKKKLTKPILALALLFGALCWGGCNYFQDDPYSDDPCRSEIYDEPKGNSYIELQPEIRDAVPYDITMKTQTFMYCDSNGFCDTLTLFLEYDSIYWENGVGDASPCDTVFYQWKQFRYKSSSNKSAFRFYMGAIHYTPTTHMNDSRLVVTLSFEDSMSIYDEYSSSIDMSLNQIRNFNQSLIDTTIKGKNYNRVKALKDENGQLAGLYNLTEGILYCQNNKYGALIKYAYKIQ